MAPLERHVSRSLRVLTHVPPRWRGSLTLAAVSRASTLRTIASRAVVLLHDRLRESATSSKGQRLPRNRLKDRNRRREELLPLLERHEIELLSRDVVHAPRWRGSLPLGAVTRGSALRTQRFVWRAVAQRFD